MLEHKELRDAMRSLRPDDGWGISGGSIEMLTGERPTDDEIDAEITRQKAGPTLDDIKAAAVQRINDAYQEELDAILHEYPDAETKTWDKQEQEARAYTADSSVSTPLLDAVANARNMDKAELVSRVIAKADTWITLSGAATGKRQRLEDEIGNAETIEAAEAVTW